MKPQDAADWWTVILAMIFTIIVVLGPIYISSNVQEETSQIIEILERQAAQAQERAEIARENSIRINARTIICLSTLDVEERTDAAMRRCIEEGLDELDTPSNVAGFFLPSSSP